MRTIFLSYHRDDTEGQAGRLYDALAARFGESAVFMDVSDIAPGRDFRWVIDEQVNTCGVLLALIGKHWLDARCADGKRRLDDTGDFVRLETVSALQRGIPVVPVLVHGARMPKADELPQELQPLAYRNGVELTHARWDSDVEVLIKALEPYVDTAPRQHERDVPGRPARRPWIWRAAAAAVAALALGGGYVGHQISNERAANAARQASQQLVEQAREREIAAEQEKVARQAQLDAEKAQQAEARRSADERARLDAQRIAHQRQLEAQRIAAEQAQAERNEAIAKLERAKRQAEIERARREAQRAQQTAEPEVYPVKPRNAALNASGACAPGYVWREARPNDRVCVPPASRTQAAADNHLAAARRAARGGAYGAATCKTGYVWREAFAGDTVCVTPETRARTAEENTRAATRLASVTRAVTQ